MSGDEPVVLVVEDEPPLVEIYTHWLESEYVVRSAQDGERALEIVDDSVDIVLLDRLMPGMTGDDVLAALRERRFEGAVAMVTAVEPDFDLVKLGADAYLIKPVNRDELLTTVSRLLDRETYANLEREFYHLVSKRAAWNACKDETALQASETYADLEARIESVHETLDERSDGMNDIEFVALVRDADEASKESE